MKPQVKSRSPRSSPRDSPRVSPGNSPRVSQRVQQLPLRLKMGFFTDLEPSPQCTPRGRLFDEIRDSDLVYHTNDELSMMSALSHPIMQRWLLNYAATLHTDENILFWQASQALLDKHETSESLRPVYRQILTQFIQPDAEREINISFERRQALLDLRDDSLYLEKLRSGLLAAVYDEIFVMLNHQTFPNFLKMLQDAKRERLAFDELQKSKAKQALLQSSSLSESSPGLKIRPRVRQGIPRTRSSRSKSSGDEGGTPQSLSPSHSTGTSPRSPESSPIERLQNRIRLTKSTGSLNQLNIQVREPCACCHTLKPLASSASCKSCKKSTCKECQDSKTRCHICAFGKCSERHNFTPEPHRKTTATLPPRRRSLSSVDVGPGESLTPLLAKVEKMIL